MTEQTHQASDGLGSRLEFETLIADTSAAIFAAPPERSDQAVEGALDRVRRFFRADRCVLLEVSADQQVVNVRLASYGEGVPRVPRELNLVKLYPSGRQKLLIERVPVRVSRAEDLPPDADVDRASRRLIGTRSNLALPIEAEAPVRHLIVLQTVHEERAWPEGLVPRLRALGQLLAGALERQALFLGLQRTEARLTSGADLAGLAFYELGPGTGDAYADDRFRELCGVPAELRGGEQLVAHWAEHLHPDDRTHLMELRRDLHDGRRAQLSVEYRFMHPTQGLRWIHHLARVARRDATGHAEVVYGVLRDVSERRRTEEELAGLSRRLIRAHEEERALLARELHDDVTQRLAVLAIDAGRAELTAANRGQAEAMRSLREGLARLSEDVHSLAYQLHPSVLEELGLAEALRTAGERLGRAGRLQVSLDLDGVPADLGKDAALCLFRVTQEALNNVARHAGARGASVTIRRTDGGLRLVVSDDGSGFDASSPGSRRSLGLASMRERVRLLDGSLELESAPGRGTTVTAWIPTGGAAT